jgi:5-(carboxyamino)imidazole ribonucleotide synthase
MPGAHLHLYGKHEARRGRKMGHVTFTAPTLDEALANQTRAREILGIPELKQARPVGPA